VGLAAPGPELIRCRRGASTVSAGTGTPVRRGASTVFYHQCAFLRDSRVWLTRSRGGGVSLLYEQVFCACVECCRLMHSHMSATSGCGQ
jgi:hypothetical protein